MTGQGSEYARFQIRKLPILLHKHGVGSSLKLGIITRTILTLLNSGRGRGSRGLGLLVVARGAVLGAALETAHEGLQLFDALGWREFRVNALVLFAPFAVRTRFLSVATNFAFDTWLARRRVHGARIGFPAQSFSQSDVRLYRRKRNCKHCLNFSSR